MAWKRITDEEAESLPFDFDEEEIEKGIEASIPAAEAAGVFGPEKQRTALASGKVGLEVENNKLIFSSFAPEQEAFSQWLFSSKDSFAEMSADQISTEIMNKVKAENDLFGENLRKIKFASSVKESLRLTEGENKRHESVMVELRRLAAEHQDKYGIHLQF